MHRVDRAEAADLESFVDEVVEVEDVDGVMIVATEGGTAISTLEIGETQPIGMNAAESVSATGATETAKASEAGAHHPVAGHH